MNKLLISLAFLFCTLPALAQTPSAMITQVDGPAVVIVKGEKNKPAAASVSLLPRTMIELRGGSEMTVVYFASGTHEHYTGPSLIGIGKNRGKVFDGAESSRTVTVTDSAMVKAIDPDALSETPGNGKLTISSVAKAPKFSWTTTLPAPYTLSVIQPAQGAKPRSVIWSKQFGLKDAVYFGPDLDPSQAYAAEVQSGDDVIAWSLFRLQGDSYELLNKAQIEADKLAKANPKDPTPHVLMNAAYAQHGQHQKAVDALNVAIQTQPTDKTFISRMDTMMGKISKKADADTAYATGFYNAQDAMWGTNAYYDPGAWAWEDGWDG
jgi:hypothetical protein